MDGDMMLADERTVEALTRSFLLGTARHTLPPEALDGLSATGTPTDELTALALLGQRMRFRRPGPTRSSDGVAPVEDARAIVPDAARPLMRRLVGARDGSASDIAALAVADACHRGKLRPHPFDLPRLDAFAKAHGECLGARAIAWAARAETVAEGVATYFDADAIDETNWTMARPAARAAFIKATRAREPDRARALVEAGFGNDPAPVRARLIHALAPGLSAADAPFLESLAKDRAPSVREGAQQLLRRIPGSAFTESRLQDLITRTKASTSGLLRRRRVLSLEPPANLQQAPHPASAATAARRWAVETYAGLPLDAIAAAFGLSLIELIEAAADDSALLALLAHQASIENRCDVLARIVREHAADAWIDALGPDDAGVETIASETAVEQWCEAAVAPALWPALPHPADLDRLYAFLRRPMPDPQARGLLDSPAFAAIGSSPAPTVGLLAVTIAALMPAALRSELRTACVSSWAEQTTRAVLLLDCLALLDPPTL
jgi:hypothetical protein